MIGPQDDQTMTPGPMLAMMKTTDEMAARAMAMTFIMVVPVWTLAGAVSFR